jgi:hypothetical protein
MKQEEEDIKAEEEDTEGNIVARRPLRHRFYVAASGQTLEMQKSTNDERLIPTIGLAPCRHARPC